MIFPGDYKQSYSPNQDMNKFVFMKHASLIEEEKDFISQSNQKMIRVFDQNQNQNFVMENDRINNYGACGLSNVGSGEKYSSSEKNLIGKFTNKRDNIIPIQSIFENNLANKNNNPVKLAVSPMQNKSNQLTMNCYENTSNEENIILPNVELIENIADNNMVADESNKQKILNVPAELLIHPADGAQTNNFYCITQDGGRIGRHSDNHIVLLEESVSRHHSIIEYLNGKFYLIDIGSTTGTFIKIDTIMKLEEGVILELGSNQFQVAFINPINENEGLIKLKVVEGPKFDEEYDVFNSGTIGRKSTGSDSITFQDDFHLSNIHAKITYSEGEFLFEDQCSTNG